MSKTVKELEPVVQQIRLELATRASREYSGISGILTGIGISLIKEDPFHGSISLVLGLGIGLLGLSDAKYSGQLNKSIKESKMPVHPDATRLRFFEDKGRNLASVARLDNSDIADPKE